MHPCFGRQGLDAARLATDDEAIHERVVREVPRAAREMDLRQSPPAVGWRIHIRCPEAAGPPAHAGCATPSALVRCSGVAYPARRSFLRGAGRTGLHWAILSQPFGLKSPVEEPTAVSPAFSHFGKGDRWNMACLT